MVLAKLAVDREHQGTGLGSALLRTLVAAETAGIRAVLLHAMSDDAKHFYLHHGFAESPIDPMMIALADVENALSGRARRR